MGYDDMLNEAYRKLPEKTLSRDRFEMPTFDTFVQGSQTIIKNFIAVCEKIRRNKNVLTKYLSRELAAPINIDGTRAIINTKTNYKLLNEKLADFVNNYVICDQCGKPDTHFVDDHHMLFLVCEACGSRRSVKKI